MFDARREAVPLGRRVVLQEVPAHTVEHDPFIKSQLAFMELTFVQIWSRSPQNVEATTPSKSTVWLVAASFCKKYLFTRRITTLSIKSRLASIKLTSEPYVVQIGSRNSSSLWQRVPRSPRCGWWPRRSARSTCPHGGGRLFQSNVNMSP